MISHHVIRRQYLHVELNGTEADGLALQRSLPALYQDALAPVIERVLDRCGPVDGQISIDRLEIDAGETTLERLQIAIAESVSLAIERALRDEIAQVSSAGTIATGNIQLKTVGQSVTEAFIYFLKTGSLPWSFRLPQGISLEQAVLNVWREWVRSGMVDSSTVDPLRRVLASKANRRRLILQFSKVFLETLLRVLSPESESVLERVFHSIGDADDSIGTEHFKRQLWEAMIGSIAEGRALTPQQLVHEAFHSLSESQVVAPAVAEALKRHWAGETGGDSFDAAVFRRRESAPITDAPEEPRNRIPPHLAKTNLSPAKLNEHPDAKEGMYVWNAGVVLLHPFLPQLFSALGIASEDQILQLARALGLLHFLTTGESQVPEYELILPKILCDVPLDTSLEYDLDLSAMERDEATALLKAVIRHWGGLGDTSPDALRGTFLLRPGKVSLRDDGDWLLQVESQGFDILLDQLPWGFSTIKLPWMKCMLWVEWG